MELGENALMTMEGKDQNQAKKKGKVKYRPKVESRRSISASSTKEGAHMKKGCTKFQKWLEKKGYAKPKEANAKHGRIWSKYFISFIDDYSRYMYIYLLHNKNEALGAFKVFKAEVEKQCGKQIKIVRTDRGGEYYGRYTEDGQAPGPLRRVCVATPSFLNPCGLKLLKHSVYIEPSSNKGCPKTPFELWKGWKPSLRHIRVWDARLKSKGYRFYCPSHSTRIVESRNAKFLENDLISGSDRFQDIVSEKDHIDAQPSTSSDRLIVIQNAPQVQTGDRQPIIEAPQIANDNPVDQVVQDSPEIVEQPVSNNWTMTLEPKMILKRFQSHKLQKSNLWYDAMKDEMNSMASNGVWNLVELPNGAKSIGCKWVFKTKKDSLGNIERYKARLVAKGFTQNEGIDYKETFSPVSKKDSLRVIMTLVAHFDLELQQMDVKMTFLNGNLEEEVYMKQPEGFSSSGGEHLVQFGPVPKNDLEREQMKNIPYASAVGSLMYVQVCTRPDIAFAVGMLRDIIVIQTDDNLEVIGYSDSTTLAALIHENQLQDMSLC
ncbi:Retrovirus-related Pol polyprotein from transposon TNT 1-94 [Vitis vinifera]|uniref:Retrovirus-related Pol polyprotein from transposon TNT 1-94 n=1 Tax=Vitis vinifera TaxID=29760 RepID=A0A438GTP0_VITVI|nr:Retrovirus-related Pol polyprotein from transposon TNT 1-94 [Vitis vinifera]